MLLFVRDIKVSDTTWGELKNLKKEYDLDNMDDVIKQLLTLYNQCKEDGLISVV